MTAKVIRLDAQKASLKRKLREHLKSLGFTKDENGALVPPSMTKESYRLVHAHHRQQKLKDSAKWIRNNAEELIGHFASGSDIDVASIRPSLQLVPGDSAASDLFRLASMNWQIPVSDGYGRRLRFLVWDEHNHKLMGLIALGDAVFNLKARDTKIGWDHLRRKDALVHMMDAYVLGAVPPYNTLLGGKVLASLIRTKEVVQAFDDKYRQTKGLISNRKKRARLVAVTTSSSLGRSSIYNRVALDGRKILEPIGYTSGWGHFHISDSLFEDFRSFLSLNKDPYADGFDFGQGPNWRIRVVKRALTLLGLKEDLVQHGMVREIYLCEIAKNARQFLCGDEPVPIYEDLPSIDEIGRKAVNRWMVPRSERRPEFKQWRAEQFLDVIGPNVLQKIYKEKTRSGMGS